MGGFKTSDGAPLTAGLLAGLWKSGKMDDIQDRLDEYLRDIVDKSKANPLVKALTCLQIIWFLVSIAFRWSSRIPISPLELTTCGYIACALITYILWWYKPYNVSERLTVQIDLLGVDPVNFNNRVKPPAMIIAVIGTFLFGASHLAAWNSVFISSSCQILWRVCGILVTIAPLVLISTAVVIEHLEIISDNGDALAIFSVILYASARTLLFLLMILSFWSLPKDVYRTSDWASILPSIM